MSIDRLLAELTTLETLLEQEQLLLCHTASNSSALQQVTDQKQQLLATVALLEKKYRPSLGKKSEQWRAVEEIAQRLNAINQHNGWLLEQQITHNQQALALFERHREPALYGADGQPKEHQSGGRKTAV